MAVQMKENGNIITEAFWWLTNSQWRRKNGLPCNFEFRLFLGISILVFGIFSIGKPQLLLICIDYSIITQFY